RIFLASSIPAALGVAVLVFMVQTPRLSLVKRVQGALSQTPLGKPFARFVSADVLFQLGNSSMAFLLLRAQRAGFTAGGVALVYLGCTPCSASLSLPFGGLSDRVGRRPLLLTGYLLYSLAYGVAAFSPTRAGVVVAFLLLAVQSSIMEGQSRSLIT